MKSRRIRWRRMMQLMSAGFLLALNPALAAKNAWNLNDVSILLPLEASRSDTPRSLKPVSPGIGGALLPRSLSASLGVIDVSSREGETLLDRLQAVSIRFAPESSEIRIVWQPVINDPSTGLPTSEDSALHTFHRLNEKQLQTAREELWSLKQSMLKAGVSTERRPLGLHPAARSPKTRAAFLRGVRRAILNTCGVSNLYRVTLMRLLTPQNWWKFDAGFEKNKDGQWVASTIPRQGAHQIDIINDATEVDTRSGLVEETDVGIFPLASYPAQDDLRPIISKTYRRTVRSDVPDAQDLPAFRRGIGAAHRFQNPKRTQPTNVDCAHCHFAQPAQNFALKTFPELRAELISHPDRYINPDPARFDLSQTSPLRASAKIVRAFGYFEDQPAIMTRTIHDSAESAHWLNTHGHGELEQDGHAP